MEYFKYNIRKTKGKIKNKTIYVEVLLKIAVISGVK